MSDVGLFLILFAALAVMLGVIRFFAWLTDFFEAGGVRAVAARYVKRSDNTGYEIMSRSPDSVRSSMTAAVRQTDLQTDQSAQWLKLSHDETLDICKTLRARGFSRDEARQLFRAFHQPLDNNLWTQAIPPDPEHITPIAGRPTKAVFDADFPFEPLS